MAFDGFFIRKMVKELEENILNGRINKINNLSTDEFVFSVRKGKNLKLFLSANSSASRIQLTNNSFDTFELLFSTEKVFNRWNNIRD